MKKHFYITVFLFVSTNICASISNMTLQIPKKWQDYNYTKLGNPKSIALLPKEYLSGDKLYKKTEKRFYNDGKKYFGADSEEKLLNLLYKTKKLKKLIVDKVRKNKLEKLISNINNIVYVDKETGRKRLVQGEADSLIEEALGEALGCVPIANNSKYQCSNWKHEASNNIRHNSITNNKEKERIYKLFRDRHIFFDIDFLLDFKTYSCMNKNISKRIKEFEKWKEKKYNKNPKKYQIYYDEDEDDFYQAIKEKRGLK